MKVNIKENASDLVRTVERAGLMADSFKDITMRTRDDLVEIFSQDDGSYEYAPEVMETALTDASGYTARASAEIIQHVRGSNSQDKMQSVEFIQQNTDEFGSDSAFSAESDELIQHRAAEYGRKRIENEKLDQKLADREAIADAGERNNKVIFDRSSSGRESHIIDARKVSLADTDSIKEKRVQQRQKEYAINKLRRQRENSPRTIWISRQDRRTGNKVANGAGRLLRKIAEDARAMITTYSAVGAVLLVVVVITILFSATFMTIGDEDGNNFAYDFYEIGPGDTAIVKVAQAQLGNVGGNKFWKWYGFSSHVHWCACFVSWCGDQCGYIKAGIIPKYAVCGTGADWFKARHRWASRGYSPKPGDIIFFDFERDGEMDHTGIVESCDGKTVTTIEGNSGNACKRQSYVRGSSQIAGYGIPSYPGGTGDQKKGKGENTKEVQ